MRLLMRRLVPGASLVLLLTVLTVPTAWATGSSSKPIAVTINPTSIGAGNTQALTLSFRNDTKSTFGSADVSNAGLTIVSVGQPTVNGYPQGTATLASGTIQLRSLNVYPGKTLVVPSTVSAACTASTWNPWAIAAKSSWDFSSGSLGVTSVTTQVTGTCSAVFAPGPANAQVLTTITSAAYDPGGPPVQLELHAANGSVLSNVAWSATLDFGNNPSGATLTGGTGSTQGGTISFPALSINRSGERYTLKANNQSGITGGVSGVFNIDDVGKICSGGVCSANVSAGGTSASIIANVPAGAALFASVDPDSEEISCAGYDSLSGVLTFGVRTSEKPVLATMTVADNGGRRFWDFQFCLGADTPFTPRQGTTLQTQGGLFVGLLPNCTFSVVPPHLSAPCTLLRLPTLSGGAKVIAVIPGAMAADPKGRI